MKRIHMTYGVSHAGILDQVIRTFALTHVMGAIWTYAHLNVRIQCAVSASSCFTQSANQKQRARVICKKKDTLHKRL